MKAPIGGQRESERMRAQGKQKTQAISKSALGAIEQIGCQTASGAQGRIKVILPEDVEVRRLYEIAASQDVQIRRLNHKRDSLEDIFLKAMEPAGSAAPAGGSGHGRL